MADFIDFLWNNRSAIYQQLIEHVELTLISLAIAILIGVSLGIVIASNKKLSKPFLTLVNVIQTIPSLALLGFLLPFLGIGIVPAITALFLYALLPIVRNTYTGIIEVDPAVTEAATGLGLSNSQLLLKVKLPLALPYIMAGIKTASVINVGVATLSAFIAAGGLGKFILQGIQLNNTYMILAGAIPASLLALFFDMVLGFLEKRSLITIRYTLIAFSIVLLSYLAFKSFDTSEQAQQGGQVKGGFPSEFIYREDGLKGLFKAYDFELAYVEMEIGLLYKALQQKDVDLISGFSTDGRIKAYDLVALEDDKNYFPPYEAAAMIRKETINNYPEILTVLNVLEGHLNDQEMTELNYKVDELGKQPEEVAREFLTESGILKDELRLQTSDDVITIGSKAFTENYILAHIFRFIIEDLSSFRVDLKLGFGGTKLLMDAMKFGEVDLYPEYTGTALLLMLEQDEKQLNKLLESPDNVYSYVKEKSLEQYGFIWSKPLGFNNTFAMLMRKKDVENYDLKTISDLTKLLD